MPIPDDDKYDKLVAGLKAGDYADRPELQMALAQEATNYKGERIVRKQSEFIQGTNQTPYAPRPRPQLSAGDQFKPAPAPPVGWEADNEARAAGVDTDTGAPPVLRAKADLLKLNPKAKVDALEFLMSEQYRKQGIELPDGIPALFKEEKTGKLAYWSPGEDGKLRATLVNPMGLDAGDALSALDDVASIAAEIPAAIGGATAGVLAGVGNPVTATIGGAGAVTMVHAAAQKARVGLAKMVGIPDSIADQVTNDQMLYDSLLAGATEFIAPAAVGMIRSARNFARPLKATEALSLPQMKKNMTALQKSTDKLERGAGVRIDVPMSVQTGDVELQIMEANVSRDAMGKTSKAYREKELLNRLNSGKAVKAINANAAPKGTRLDMDPSEVGNAVKDVLAKPAIKAEQQAARAARTQEEVLDEVADLYSMDKWGSVQRNLSDAADNALQAETKTWDDFRQTIGYDPKTRQSDILLPNEPDSPINTALKNLDEDAQKALSQDLAKAKLSLVEDLGYKATDEVPGLADPVVDMNHLHALLSDLKNQARRIDKGHTAPGWRGGDIKGVIKAIEDQIDRNMYVKPSRMAAGDSSLPRSQGMVQGEAGEAITNSFRAANKATRTRHEMFDELVKKRMFATDTRGRFVRDPNAIRGMVFKKGDSETLTNVLDVVGHNPEVRAGMLNELNVMFKTAALRDGKLAPDAARNFLNDYSGHLDALLGKDRTTFMRNARDFDAAARKATDVASLVRTRLEKAYGRTLSSDGLYAGNIAQDLLTSKELGISNIRAIKETLKRSDPKLWKEVQVNGLKEVENHMLRAGGNEANAGKIRNLLVNNEGRLKELYGAKYVDNIKALQDVTAAMDQVKMAKASRVVLNPPWLLVARSYFGPLSSVQRRITAGTRLYKAVKDDAIREMLANPDRLDAFVKLGRMKPATVGYLQAATAAQIGIEHLDEDTQRMAQGLQQDTQRGTESENVRELRALNRSPR